MKNTNNEEQALVTQSGFLALQNFNMTDAMEDELAGLSLSFDKIKIPAGGSITFEVPGEDPDSPDVVKEFSGVIVYHHPVRMYYREKYNGANNPPDCGSLDGIFGIGNPGGSCAKCPYNQFGTALDDGTGKGCKDRRRIYILREGEVFPLLLSLPTGSLKNLTTYIQRLLSKGKKSSTVVTEFSLKKAFNANNIAYSQAVFNVGRPLTSEEQIAIKNVAEQVKAYSNGRIGNSSIFDIDGELLKANAKSKNQLDCIGLQYTFDAYAKLLRAEAISEEKIRITFSEKVAFQVSNPQDYIFVSDIASKEKINIKAVSIEPIEGDLKTGAIKYDITFSQKIPKSGQVRLIEDLKSLSADNDRFSISGLVKAVDGKAVGANQYDAITQYDVAAVNYYYSDNVAPSVPCNLLVLAKSSNTVTFTWDSSVDNEEVTGYAIYRDGIQVGISRTTVYTDTGIYQTKSATYTVKAFDKVGNNSAQSEKLIVNFSTNVGVVTPEVPQIPELPNSNTQTFTYQESISIPMLYASAEYEPSVDITSTQSCDIMSSEETIKITVSLSNLINVNTGIKEYTTYCDFDYNRFDYISCERADGSQIDEDDTFENIDPERGLVVIFFSDTKGSKNIGLQEGDMYVLTFKVKKNAPLGTSYFFIRQLNTTSSYYPIDFSEAGANRVTPTFTPWRMQVEVVEKPPVITIGDYITTPTNKDITVTASTDSGKLIDTSYTFTENGSFDFIVVDEMGYITAITTVTITNIDKTAPNITIAEYATKPTNQDIVITASTDEGKLNTNTCTFTENGSFTFIATDEAGNVTTKTVMISNIDKTPPKIIGIENGGVYNADDIIAFDEGKAVLNNDDFLIGSEVAKDGTYTLVVTDEAGNVTTITFTIDSTSPDKVANLSKPEQIYNGVKITWDSSNDNLGVVGYEVYRDGQLIGTTTTNSFVDVGLTDGDHTYSVKAFDQAGNTSEPSSYMSFSYSQSEILMGIIPCTTLGTIIAHMNLNSNQTITAYYPDANGTQLLITDYVGTGTTINIMTDGIVTEAYTVLIKGDIDGDGTITVSDMTLIKSHLLHAITLEGIYYQAGDFYNDGISISDLLTIKKYLLQVGTIEQDIVGEIPSAFVDAINYINPVLNLYIGNKTSNSITLVWNDISSQSRSIIRYDIYRNGVLIGTSLTNSYTDTSLTQGTDHIYTVKAVDNHSNGYIRCSFGINTAFYFGMDGVYSPTGNYSKSFTDIDLNSITAFTRTYNSLDAYIGAFGLGWTFGFESKMINGVYNKKYIKLPNGKVITFNLVDGLYTAYDSRNTLTKNQDNSFTMETKEQVKYYYNSYGYLTKIEDMNGNAVIINVDSNGKVHSVTDIDGCVYTIEYTNGFISRIYNSYSINIIYEYESGNLKRVKDSEGNTIYTYNYDSSGFLNEILDGLGHTVEAVSYNHQASKDRVNTYTDVNGNTYTFSYDDINKIVTKNDFYTRDTVITYNSLNQIISITDPYSTGSVPKTTYIEYYNIQGEIKSITDRNGNKTEYEIDLNGNITKIINPDLSFKSFTYNEENQILTATDECGNMTFYVYYNDGKLHKKAQRISGIYGYGETGYNEEDFAVTTYTYYPNHSIKGLIETVTDPDGGLTTYTYDTFGNVLTVTVLVESTPVVKNDVTTYTYYDNGLLETETKPDGYTTKYEYDKNGRVVRITRNGDEVNRILYDVNGRKVREISPNQYDSTKDGLNYSTPQQTYINNSTGTYYTYDNNGRLETKTDYVYEGTTLKSTLVTSYTYNKYGYVLTQKNPDGTGTKYEYLDVMNRNTKISHFDSINPDGTFVNEILLSWSYVEIIAGGKTKKIEIIYLNNTDTAKTETIFDYAGRVIKTTNPDNTGDITIYNANGTVASTEKMKEYFISATHDSLPPVTYVFDVANNSMDAGGELIRYGKHGGDNQIFIFEEVNTYSSDLVVGKEYYIRAKSSGLYLEVSDPNGSNQSIIKQNYFTGNANQKFKLIQSNQTGYFELKAMCSTGVERTIDIGGPANTSGLYPIYIYNNVSTSNQDLTFTQNGLTSRTYYKYDGLNRLTEKWTSVDDNNGSADYHNYNYSYETTSYYNSGKVKENKKGKSFVALWGIPTTFAVTTYDYYLNGQIKSVIDNEGRKTEYSYGKNIEEGVVVGYINTIKQFVDAVNFVETQKIRDYSTNEEFDVLYVKQGDLYIYDDPNYPLLDEQNSLYNTPCAVTTKYLYDSNGNLIKITNPDLSYESFEYDSLNRQIKSTKTCLNDSNQEEVRVLSVTVYGINGKVSSTTDDNSVETMYEYNTRGFLTKLTVKGLTTAGDKITLYGYDKAGRMIAQVTSDNYKANLNDDINQMNRTLYTYDEMSRVILVEKCYYDSELATWVTFVDKAYKYSPTSGSLVKVLDSLGYAEGYGEGKTIEQITKDGYGIEYTYNLANQLVMVLDPEAKMNNKAFTNKYLYDALGRKTVEENISGSKIIYAYDDAGNLLTTTNAGVTPNVITQTNTYDKLGRLLTQTDSTGVTTYTYNAFGEPSKVDYCKNGDTVHYIISYKYDVTSNLTFKREMFGNETGYKNYVYDKKGNLKTITSAPYSEIDPADGIAKMYTTKTIYTYDDYGRILNTKIEKLDSNNVEITSITTSSTYDSFGKILTQTDAKGKVTTYVYNEKELLWKVIDPEDGVIAYYYDENNRVIATVSPKNYIENETYEHMVRTRYSYDIRGRLQLIEEVTPNYTNGQWSYTSIVKKAYKYDSNSNVVKELDALGYAAGIGTTIDEKINSGYGTEYTFNALNQLVQILDPETKVKLGANAFSFMYTYDGNGRKETEINAIGVITRYTYDIYGNMDGEYIKKSSNDPEFKISGSTFDDKGNLLTKTDAYNHTTTYEYNAFGKVRTITYPGDTTMPSYVVYYEYDVNGNLVCEYDSIGIKTVYTYDYLGRMLTKTKSNNDTNSTNALTISKTYDNNGNVLTSTDEFGNETSYTYYDTNRLHEETKSGQTTTYQYDKNGNLTHTIDWLGNDWENEYDSFNRLKKKLDPYDKTIQRLEYDNNNNIIETYDAYERKTEYTYDKNNRLLTTMDPLGHITGQTYDNVGNIQTKSTEEVNNVINGSHNITTLHYDEFNRLVEIINAKSEVTLYHYDKNGNMIYTGGSVKTYEYNAMNKVTKAIDSGGRSGTEGNYTYDYSRVESYTYYANGLLHTKTDRNGNTTTYTYDCHGRILTEAIPNETTITYTYDDALNKITVTDSTGTTETTYDFNRRILSKYVSGIGTIYYQYDITANYETGFVAQSSTDPKNNVVTKVYDKAGRLKYVTADGQTTTYNYFYDGSRENVIYNDGSKEEYTYYNDGLLHTLMNKKADDTVINSYHYEYDAAHNMTEKIDLEQGKTEYKYDALNRLIEVYEYNNTTIVSKTTIYEYDESGNRLTEAVTTGSNTKLIVTGYTVLNTPYGAYIYINGIFAETSDYFYDNNGNCTEYLKTTYDEYENPISFISINVNTYNKRNQLITTVTRDDNNNITSTVQSTYNAEGYRVSKAVGGVTTKYLYEYDKVILEVDTSNNQLAWNVYGENLISRKVVANTLNYMYNGHSDVTALVNSTTGIVAATYYYDAFGKLADTWGNPNNSITYAGYQYDKETGYYYINARMYDPVTARFLQEDTYAGKYNEPLSLNRYTYCYNNPLKYIDPTGHWVDLGNNVWKAESGNTLSGLAQKTTGNGANWKYIGFPRDPKTLQVGEKVNITNMLNTVYGTGSTQTSTSSPPPTTTTTQSTVQKATINANATVVNVRSTSYLGVRAEANDSKPEIGKVFNRERIEVVRWSEYFSYIRYLLDNGTGTKEGYAHSAYIKRDNDNVGVDNKDDDQNNSTSINSNINNIIDAVGNLEKLAQSYHKNSSNMHINTLVLQFIRRNNYSKGNWPSVAGSIDNGFVKYVQDKNTELFNYFSKGNSGTGLIDPISGVSIDFIHFAATLNAQIHYKTLDADEINDFAGWAGDLQQTIKDLHTARKNFGSEYLKDDLNYLTALAKERIGIQPGNLGRIDVAGFTISDMLADVDAVNLGKILNVNNAPLLSNAMRNYYNDGAKIRYNLFLNNMGGIDSLKRKANDYTVGSLGIFAGPIKSNIFGDSGNNLGLAITKNEAQALADAFVFFIQQNQK